MAEKDEENFFRVMPKDEEPEWMHKLRSETIIQFMHGLAFHEVMNRMKEQAIGDTIMEIGVGESIKEIPNGPEKMLEIMCGVMMAYLKKMTEELGPEPFHKYLAPLVDIMARALTQTETIPAVPIERGEELQERVKKRAIEVIQHKLSRGEEVSSHVFRDPDLAHLNPMKGTATPPKSKEELEAEFSGEDALQRAIRQLKAVAKGTIH